jgi:TolB-like protein/Flp pilus assembly protein TadD
MARAIDDFGNRLKKYDVGLFFYAGHGVQSKGFNYLIPVDADLNSESDVEYNCVRADRVLGKMEDAKSKINLVILDACRNNPYERSWTRTSRSRGLATMTAPAGSVIAFATSPGSTADDGPGKNGLYTSGLLNHMNEPGITAIQMFQKVTAFVLKKSNNQQLPWVSTSLTGDFYLVPGSGKADNTQILSKTEVYNNSHDNQKTIVVLPFKNLTGKPELDYLVQGQDLGLYTGLSDISQVRPLRVLTGQTASRFMNPSTSVSELAGEINADFLVQGSVLRSANDSIILQISLNQAYPEERLVWAKIFTSDISNVYKLYNNIAGQVVDKIGFGLTTENLLKLPAPGKVNINAYKASLRGMHYLNYPSQDSVRKGFEFLKEAINLDPADPNAYTNLALGYLDIAHSALDPGDALIKAEAAASRAIKLDTTIAATYSALAQLNYYQFWRFDDSEKYFRKALALDPNSAITHYHYSWLLVLFGRMDEAIAEHKLAQRYDPENPQHTAWLGYLYYFVGRNDEAIEEAKKSFELQKDYPIGYYVLGSTYLAMGRNAEALEAHIKLAQLYPEWKYALGLTYIATGNRGEAEKILADIEKERITPWNAYALANLNAALDKKEEALKWVNYEPHHAFIVWAAVDPTFDCCYGDPRWNEFLKRVNLPK